MFSGQNWRYWYIFSMIKCEIKIFSENFMPLTINETAICPLQKKSIKSKHRTSWKLCDHLSPLVLWFYTEIFSRIVDLCILTLLSISMKEGKSSFLIKISVWIVFIACPKYWGHGRCRSMWFQRTPLHSGKKCNKKCMYCYFRALCPID